MVTMTKTLSPLARFCERMIEDPWDGRFSPQVLAAAEMIWSGGAVRFRGKENEVFRFAVRGNAPDPYTVEIAKWGREFFMHCTCLNGRRLGSRGECYHLAAVCLRVMRRAYAALEKREKENNDDS